MNSHLTPQQAANNFKLLHSIVENAGNYSPNQLVAELQNQLTGLIAQGVQGDDAHPLKIEES